MQKVCWSMCQCVAGTSPGGNYGYGAMLHKTLNILILDKIQSMLPVNKEIQNWKIITHLIYWVNNVHIPQIQGKSEIGNQQNGSNLSKRTDTSNFGMFLLVPPSNASTGNNAKVGPFMSTRKFWK